MLREYRDGTMPVGTRTCVLAIFAALALLFAVTGVVALARLHDSQTQTRALVTNMMRSNDLVATLGREVDHERLLLDEHVLEKGAARMNDLEKDVSAIEAKLHATAAAYDALAALPGERAEWEKLKEELASVADPIQHMIALSRENRDVEAFAARQQLNGRFATIDRAVTTIIGINRAGAERTVAEMSAMQHATGWFMGSMSVTGLALTVVVGVAVARLVQGRETRLRGHSEALEARNRDLDAFAGRVAHDLRGPLTTVGFALSRLEQRDIGEPGTMAILHRAASRMERLIDDLLTLSRIGVSNDRAVCDPEQAVAEVREDVAVRLRGDDTRMRVHVDAASVHCTEGLLRQAVYNLVDNAIKYRRRDVRLELEVDGHRVADRYELRVRDNGIGMSPEQARRAFDPFYRALESREIAGTGLGLSIVKRIAEASGGEVRVDSLPGGGTMFVIALPFARQA